MRYLITFSYDGTNFNGYQKQPNLRTVQGEIEEALKRISNKKVDLQSSGRTDAGVHAISQTAHFDLDMIITLYKLKTALNGYTGEDIYIKNVKEIDDNFHARYMAKKKEYIYKINIGEYNPVERNYVYQYNKQLDILEIKKALKLFEGTHDFTSFSCKEDLKEDNIRTILKTKVNYNKNCNMITISFIGTGFLKYQVRNMIGTLIEVGEHKRNSIDIPKLLELCDRNCAGITAKPEGLYLKEVYYK